MEINKVIEIELSEKELKEIVQQYLKTKKIKVNKEKIIFSKTNRIKMIPLIPPIGESDFIHTPIFTCTAQGTMEESE